MWRAAPLPMFALPLELLDLVIIVLAWIGVAGLSWGPWLVWFGLLVYLISAVMRATKRTI